MLPDGDFTGGEMGGVIEDNTSKLTREDRLAIADGVIDNDSSPQALHSQVDALHREYLKLASDGVDRGLSF